MLTQFVGDASAPSHSQLAHTRHVYFVNDLAGYVHSRNTVLTFNVLCLLYRGRYIPAKYESIFSEFDKTDKKGLSPRDIWHMWCITKNPFDAFGWFAFMFEWSFTWFLVADVDNNILHKEDIRRVYDGTMYVQQWAIDTHWPVC